jgi:Effector protein
MSGLSHFLHSHLHPHHRPHHLHYHHVTIDGTGTKSYATSSQYEHAVLHELRRIHHSHTGQAVFHEFTRRSHHLMTILPYEQAQLNAFAAAKDLRHATLKGQVERSGANGQVLLDAQGKPIIGLGGGSDSDISFTPVMFTKFCNQQKPGHKAGAQPDEVLFHEMVHATRQMRGILNPLPLGFLYDTEEEFFAILLANIYASETGRPVDLRSDHHGFTHLTTDTDAKFLPKKDMTDYRYRLVDKLVHQEPRMVHELKRLRHTPFNPIRRYFELQRTSVHVHHH